LPALFFRQDHQAAHARQIPPEQAATRVRRARVLRAVYRESWHVARGAWRVKKKQAATYNTGMALSSRATIPGPARQSVQPAQAVRPQ